VVGVVEEIGEGVGEDTVAEFPPGEKVGVPWLRNTCGTCRYCRRGQENLCENARFTGYTLDGGYAEYAVADARYAFPVPGAYGDVEAAPLLCAGLIGYRTYRLAKESLGRAPERVGIYGFGAAGHLVAQVAAAEGAAVYAFTREGDAEGQAFARRLGAAWAGASTEAPPEPLDAALLFAPVGALVPAALKAVDRGGAVVSGGIHMSDVPSIPYRLLWEERTLRSVANLTRRDGLDFLALAPRVPVRTETTAYPLEAANEALADLRDGRLTGAAVLMP
jgi:propanol-preferring alcohol dehydrogenase